MDKTVLCAEGYRFGSEKDLEQAELEKKRVDYFRAKMNRRNIKGMLAVYDKLLDDKIFVTPVGWEFLRELQMDMASAGVPLEQIRPIPLYVTFLHGEREDTASPVRQRIRSTKKTDTAKRQFRLSLGINVVLAILVVSLFAIALKSDNPNILNYERALVDKYATWEQELTQRERELKQRENELAKQIDGVAVDTQ